MLNQSRVSWFWQGRGDAHGRFVGRWNVLLGSIEAGVSGMGSVGERTRPLPPYHLSPLNRLHTDFSLGTAADKLTKASYGTSAMSLLSSKLVVSWL